jgi:hypothetical protein
VYGPMSTEVLEQQCEGMLLITETAAWFIPAGSVLGAADQRRRRAVA